MGIQPQYPPQGQPYQGQGAPYPPQQHGSPYPPPQQGAPYPPQQQGQQPYPGQPPQGQPYQGQPPHQGQPQDQPYPGQPPYQGQPQGQPYQGEPVKNPDAKVTEPSYVCACRVRTSYWVRKQGFWRGLWWGVCIPLFSLVLIVLLLYLGSTGLAEHKTGLVVLGFGLPAGIYLLGLGLQLWEGHRWWCLVWRSVAMLFLLPALIVGLLASF